MQVFLVFRGMAITERVVRDEKSTAYLQRKHFELGRSGFTTAVQSNRMKCEKLEPESEDIFKRLSSAAKEALEFA